MTFRLHEEVALVQHDDTGRPIEHATVYYGTVTEVRLLSVRARGDDGAEELFLIDSKGRAWRDGGRWRLVPVCAFCDMPILGTPVTSEGDPLDRKWCSGECGYGY